MIAHRVVFGVHSEVFEVLLGANFIESEQKDINIDAPVEAFKILMKYLYTGSVDLRQHAVKDVVEFLELCHRFDITELEQQIQDYLCVVVDPQNAIKVLQIAKLLEIERLEELCWYIVDMSIEGFHEVDEDLTYDILAELILHRGSFLSQANLFKVLVKFTSSPNFCSEEQKEELFQGIKYEKMNAVELFTVVKPSKCLSTDQFLKLIEDICHENSQQLHERLNLQKTIMIKNEFFAISDDETNTYVFVQKNEIGGNAKKYILIDLEGIYTFNCLKFSACRFFDGFVVEVSKDLESWCKVIDYEDIWSTMDHTIYFLETRARYIKILADIDLNEDNLNSIKIFYDPEPKANFAGFLVPSENVIPDKIKVKKFNKDQVRSVIQLISNVHENNGLNTRYVAHKINQNEKLEISLWQPCILSSCRFRLWDFDERKFSYTVSVTLDHNKHEIISKKLDADGWQTIKFCPRPVKAFVFEGLSSTIGDDFRLAHFEAPVF